MFGGLRIHLGIALLSQCGHGRLAPDGDIEGSDLSDLDALSLPLELNPARRGAGTFAGRFGHPSTIRCWIVFCRVRQLPE